MLGHDLAHLHQVRGEVDRAHELETELDDQLRQLHESLEPQSTRPPADPDVTAAIERVLKPLPAHHPGAPDAQQEAAAARRVTDVAQDRQRPRGRYQPGQHGSHRSTPRKREPSSLPTGAGALRPPRPLRRASATGSRFSPKPADSRWPQQTDETAENSWEQKRSRPRT
jgi:hypothetical protein